MASMGATFMLDVRLNFGLERKWQKASYYCGEGRTACLRTPAFSLVLCFAGGASLGQLVCHGAGALTSVLVRAYDRRHATRGK
ncbi:hypothetical protein UVI_02044710 [Ustilaginoidea virens]|uniref:Uncharacterized protein n=1 Tax=Ustilaginoidea virens TaxID=1159556 RepID=A0A1B5L1J5_USTVR|nr:hypothetical protein UVI_02044710 [Ustilaginoidea virens]